MNQVLSAQEVIATAANLTPEQIHQTLQTSFDETMDQYRRILNRLSMAEDFPEVKVAAQPIAITNGALLKPLKEELNGEESVKRPN